MWALFLPISLNPTVNVFIINLIDIWILNCQIFLSFSKLLWKWEDDFPDVQNEWRKCWCKSFTTNRHFSFCLLRCSLISCSSPYITGKKKYIKAYVELLCFFLFTSLRLQCTVVLLEDKMTKRHKFTIKERKTGDKLTGVRKRETEKERDLTI